MTFLILCSDSPSFHQSTVISFFFFARSGFLWLAVELRYQSAVLVDDSRLCLSLSRSPFLLRGFSWNIDLCFFGQFEILLFVE